MEPTAAAPDIAVQDFSTAADAPALWDRLVAESAEGWFWHTRANFDFNFCAAREFDARDLSFFVLLKGEPVGVVPLTLQNRRLGEYAGREASYYSGFLPWPCFRPGLAELPALEDFAFAEMERRAREAGAGRLRVRAWAASSVDGEDGRLARIAGTRRFVQNRMNSHRISLAPDALANVRERYRRYHRKYSPQFELEVVDGAKLDAQWEQTYFELHVKDAGGQFRSRESYARQVDLARKGEGFYVAARHKARGVVAGMLLVSLYKNAAFDNSVGVDPEFQDLYVSHLLKWRAIEELLARGAKTYELGERAEPATFTKIPSAKQRGISHFKEGWARGGLRTVIELEKYFDERFLAAQFDAFRAAAAEYFRPPSAPEPGQSAE